jgi:hypothetical protein
MNTAKIQVNIIKDAIGTPILIISFSIMLVVSGDFIAVKKGNQGTIS